MNPLDIPNEGTQLPRVARLLVPLLGLFFLVYPIRVTLANNPSREQVVLLWGGFQSLCSFTSG